MKITKIETQVKTRGRYSVYVDDSFAFGISELGLIETGLRIGQEIDQGGLAELKKQAATDKIYNLTLSLIVRRPRSRWEIQDYLKRKSVDPVAAEKIMSLLEEKGFIDDENFARRWVDNRRLLKSVSRLKLKSELKAKRISDEIITKTLSEDETDEFEVLKQEIDKKRRQTKYKDDLKLMQYLARQGYRYDDIKRALAAGDAG